MKKLSVAFTVLALLLSHLMCAVVAYNYCALWWGGRYAGWSFPPRVAFTLLIPYSAAIIVCLALAWLFRRKHNATN